MERGPVKAMLKFLKQKMNPGALSEKSRQRLAFVGDGISRGLLITFFAMLAIHLFQDMQLQFRLSSFFLLIQESLLVGMLLIRRSSVSTSVRLHEWATAFTATFLVLMLRSHGSSEYLIGTALSSAGAFVGIFGIIALNRSFGIVPANRGIKTGGIYRYVRHPLYASYLISFSGFLINNFSLYNSLLLAVWFSIQTARLLMEERHLSQSPEYRAFMQSTRWRLVPGIW